MWREDPPNGCTRLMRASTRGGRGGPLTHQRSLPARSQGREGGTPTRQCALPARSQGMKEDQWQERHKATKSGAETETEERDEGDEEGDRDGETSRGAQQEVVRVGSNVPPLE